MTGNIYRLVREHNEGRLTMDELKLAFEQSDRQLAKRQLTWFKRHSFIQWLPLDKAKDYISSSLAS
jgi:tRNA A37 N6-isopentenylltransferase MiaA